MIKIWIPDGAVAILRMLNDRGHDSYVVGGCVRDSLLGRSPNDWDICTGASPDEVRSCFAGRRIIATGLKHGTVTIIMEDGQYEVTTFRVDGAYSDGRHPDHVSFTDSLRADLSRRDFTINAMAYSDRVGLVDPFGGCTDLRHGIISCVGDPGQRFSEDALRVLRALRFSSAYQFQIEARTAEAVHKAASLLCGVSAERIRVELCKTLSGAGVLDVLLHYSDVIAAIIPELRACIGFEQNNRYHQYTVFEHIAHAVANYQGGDTSVNVALLLHDIGKPHCYTEDARGGHFHGHGVFSRDIAQEVLTRLRFDNKAKSDILELVLYHDSVIEPEARVVKRWLNRIGPEQFYRLLDVRLADIRAHAEGTQASRLERCIALRQIANEVIAQRECFSLRDLAINGRDIIRLGVPEGKAVGRILNALLGRVTGGTLPNDRDALMSAAELMAKAEHEHQHNNFLRS